MAKQEPRLLFGGLSGHVYIVTKYKELKNGTVEALEKYDVTDAFHDLVTNFVPQEPVEREYGIQRVGDDREPLAVGLEVALALTQWLPDAFVLVSRDLRRGAWTPA